MSLLIVIQSTTTRAIELHGHITDELSVVSLYALTILICLIESCISILLRCMDRLLIRKFQPLLLHLKSMILDSLITLHLNRVSLVCCHIHTQVLFFLCYGLNFFSLLIHFLNGLMKNYLLRFNLRSGWWSMLLYDRRYIPLLSCLLNLQIVDSPLIVPCLCKIVLLGKCGWRHLTTKRSLLSCS